MAKKTAMVAIRVTPEKRRELDIMLAHKGLRLQQFIESFIDQELVAFDPQTQQKTDSHNE